MEEVHLQKFSRQNKQKQGLSLQGDQQVKKPMNNVAQISKHLDKWQTITKDPLMLDIVKNSYTIEFTDLPRQETVVKSQDSPKNANCNRIVNFKTSFLSSKNSEFKNSRLLQQALSCRQKARGSRPVLDLNKLNNFVANEKFKMEGLSFRNFF